MRMIEPDRLKDIMEFDHVIRVNPDGTVTDVDDIYAPELNDGGVGAGWTLMDGYSSQYGYAGPIMHQSEYIGGTMAADILATPGVYVALVDSPSDDTEPDGWAVACMIGSQSDDPICERCRQITPEDEFDTDAGLCPACCAYNDSRVVL